MAKNKGQDGVRAPFIPQYKTSLEDGRIKEDNYMVYLSTFVAVCGSFSFGTGVGYSSPTQFAIGEELNLSVAEFSLFGSILTFGAMVGAITSGPIADFFGRKGALRLSTGFCAIGWLAIYYAKGPVPLDVGRVTTGYGMGLYSYVVPVFIAEIAPKQLRGALTTTNQLLIVTGVSVSFIIGTMLTWRTLALTGLIPLAVLVLGLFFIPESPRWLAKAGRVNEFEDALTKLRGRNTDISDEATEIKEYIETTEKLPKVQLADLMQKRNLTPIIIGVGLMVFQQFGGINAYCFYASAIFESAGFPPDLGTIIYAILQVVLTALGAFFIDNAGRKPLLLISATGLTLGCMLTGLSFFLKTYEMGVKAAPAFAIAGILVYIGSFSIGMGAIPWVIMSEVFPINIKGIGGSLTTLVNWFGAWVVSYTFNFLLRWCSYGTFLLYAAMNILAIFFVIKVVPETKGRTLEEIHAEMNG